MTCQKTERISALKLTYTLAASIRTKVPTFAFVCAVSYGEKKKLFKKRITYVVYSVKKGTHYIQTLLKFEKYLLNATSVNILPCFGSSYYTVKDWLGAFMSACKMLSDARLNLSLKTRSMYGRIGALRDLISRTCNSHYG